MVLTRADRVDAARRDEIRGRVESLRPATAPLAWAEAEHRPVSLRRWTAASLPLEAAHGRRVAAFAAIGNPDAFRATLEAIGAEVVAFHPLADHHAYSADDVAALAARAAAARADLVISTLKDLVKVRRDDIAGLPLAALEIALTIRTGEDELAALVRRAAGRPA